MFIGWLPSVASPRDMGEGLPVDNAVYEKYYYLFHWIFLILCMHSNFPRGAAPGQLNHIRENCLDDIPTYRDYHPLP